MIQLAQLSLITLFIRGVLSVEKTRLLRYTLSYLGATSHDEMTHQFI